MRISRREALGGLTGAALAGLGTAPGEAVSDIEDADAVRARMAAYDPVWTQQSTSSAESMPCGAGDIGLNVWVEDGDVLFYVQRSGAFDDTNSYLKLGRIRLRFDPAPFVADAPFRQRLHLIDGEIVIAGEVQGQPFLLTLWADAYDPVVHVAIDCGVPVELAASLESWRTRDRDYLPAEMPMHRSYDGAPVVPRQRADRLAFAGGGVVTMQRNRTEGTVFDLLVAQQGLAEVRDRLTDTVGGRGFGMLMQCATLSPDGPTAGRYGSVDYTGLRMSGRARRHDLRLFCHVAQTPSDEAWHAGLRDLVRRDGASAAVSRERSRRWWHGFWARSHITIEPGPARPDSRPWRLGRNYQLFRHQLGTNARGEWPTKFNGGNFTVDPQHVDPRFALSPDYRAWGGGIFTAQNQRLVYWPLLKSGDTDLMRPQFAFYHRMLPAAEARTAVYWQHPGACFTEQIENFGLPSGQEYGWDRKWDSPVAKLPGIQDSAYVAYQWDTVLEFCLMMIEAARFAGEDVSGHLRLIDSCLTFFDEHYRREYRRIAGRDLDDAGKLVLFPGTACETYKTALNATPTVAGLDAVLGGLIALPDAMVGADRKQRYRAMRDTLPPIATRRMAGRTVIAPAKLWDRIQNVEIPQLYSVFPYDQHGVGRPDLQLAIDTWHHGVDTPEQKDIVSWHQDPIFCARLGLVEEAAELTSAKLDDAPRRYPTFWGPGHDWVPDHNWGGSGMIALQEMLMQTPGDAIHLFAAWPRDWDVSFRLHAPRSTVVEAELRDGVLARLTVEPRSAAARIVLPDWLTVSVAE